jgi:hypothetical protein
VMAPMCTGLFIAYKCVRISHLATDLSFQIRLVTGCPNPAHQRLSNSQRNTLIILVMEYAPPAAAAPKPMSALYSGLRHVESATEEDKGRRVALEDSTTAPKGETRQSYHRASASLGPPTSLAPPPPTKKPTRVFELLRFDVLKIVELDSVKQTFKAQIFIQFRLSGCAKDKDLLAPPEYDNHNHVIFPLDAATGKPTFRPPAVWYLDQLDFHNAYERAALSTLDSPKATVDGDDLLLAMRIEGEFLEPMELEDFPADEQPLHVRVVLNCRKEGAVPADIVVPIDHKTGAPTTGHVSARRGRERRRSAAVVYACARACARACVERARHALGAPGTRLAHAARAWRRRPTNARVVPSLAVARVLKKGYHPLTYPSPHP